MITHTLKNGTKVKDITGHVVKIGDCPQIYELMKGQKK